MESFKDWLELDEGVWDRIKAGAKSAGKNLWGGVKDLATSLPQAAYGAGKAAYGLGRGLVGSTQASNPAFAADQFKKGAQNIGSGAYNVAAGLGKIPRGLAKLAGSPFAAAAGYGQQAGREEDVPVADLAPEKAAQVRLRPGSSDMPPLPTSVNKLLNRFKQEMQGQTNVTPNAARILKQLKSLGITIKQKGRNGTPTPGDFVVYSAPTGTPAPKAEKTPGDFEMYASQLKKPNGKEPQGPLAKNPRRKPDNDNSWKDKSYFDIPK